MSQTVPDKGSGQAVLQTVPDKESGQAVAPSYGGQAKSRASNRPDSNRPVSNRR